MKIDFMKEKDTFLGYCMINAVTYKRKGIDQVIENSKDGSYDVQFIVNGVELPLIETFEDIKNQIDRMVCEKAQELIEEKFMNFTDFVDEITRELKRKSREKFGLEIVD